VRGARGILINIMGSSRLSLHEVNEACTLIRNAAVNEDVQINFGVVLNEAMGEEVKITVIATGFERENLPAIERKRNAVSAAAGPRTASGAGGSAGIFPGAGADRRRIRTCSGGHGGDGRDIGQSSGRSVVRRSGRPRYPSPRPPLRAVTF
jgi:hypothetical protein